MAADDSDLVYLKKYGHRACFVIEIVVCNRVAIFVQAEKLDDILQTT